jgi:DNA-binding CsgD family transcriptional regulator
MAHQRSLVRRTGPSAGARDDRALRRRLLDEISGTVRFDAYVWVLTDPETSVGAAPLAEVPPPLLPRLPALIGLKYLTAVNRWTALRRPVASLQRTTGGDPSRSRLWRDLLAGHGVVDVASCVFRDRYGCWGFLDLWRTSPAARFADASFADGELAYLAAITGEVTTALRRCQAEAFADPPAVRRGRAGPVVLLLGPDLRVRGQTPQAHDYLRALVPPPDGQVPVPAAAYNAAAQLLAVEAGVDRNPPFTRVHLSDGLWLSLRAARIDAVGPAGGSGRERDIAVTIEECSPAERVALFARTSGLSARETELLERLTTGADTAELARGMFVSEHTVQDHLKSIFAKTGAHNRRTLLSRALGA